MAQKRKIARDLRTGTQPSATDPRAELLRRLLLAFITALIVARPFVLGEDPGLLVPFSGIANQLFALLWLLAALCWAVWRFWSRQSVGSWSAIELAFVALVLVIFVSAFVSAHYRRPAVLIAWEWLVLLVAFAQVRRLVQTSAETRGLLAAVLATGVSLGAYSIYQYVVELPRDRAAFADPDVLRKELKKQLDIDVASDDAHMEIWRDRIQQNNTFGTYAHPNSFAGFLALMIFPISGLTLASIRRNGVKPRSVLALLCTLLLALGLMFTHSRGAILAIVIVGAVLATYTLFQAGSRISVRRALLGLAALLTAVIIAATTEVGRYGFQRATRSFGLRTGYWSATWSMIRDHGFLGIGPGDFGRLYPRYMLPTASEKIQNPHNLFLEIWACSGILALLVLLVVFGCFFWNVTRKAMTALSEQDGKRDTSETLIPWEFYAGGLLGLLLGFLLRAGELASSQIIMEGLLSGGRGLIWCVAFGVLSSIPWTGPSRVTLLAAGVLVALLNLTVSDGISQPSVVLPLWVMAALALGPVARQSIAAAEPHWFLRALPIPMLAGLSLTYFLMIFVPVSGCASALAEAHAHYGESEGAPGWFNEVRPRMSAIPAAKYLQENIIKPLDEAAAADPGAVQPHLELATWLEQKWQVTGNRDAAQKALAEASRSQHLDPDSSQGFLAEYVLEKNLAQQDTKNRIEHYARAAKALRAVVDRDPSEARLRYQFANLLFLADDPVKARDQAREALKLHEIASEPTRQLDEGQVRQIQEWLAQKRN
jgi:hypothetical protein